MKALKITTGNEIAAIEVEQPPYRSVGAIVGGPIEITRPRGLARHLVMVVDEEGRLRDKNVNLIGSALYGTLKHGSPIVGDIVLMREEPGPDGYDLSGLSNEDITELTRGCEYILALHKKGVI
jgi:hypothetical protein